MVARKARTMAQHPIVLMSLMSLTSLLLLLDGAEGVATLSMEDLPEYEILPFPPKENVTSARSNNKQQPPRPTKPTKPIKQQAQVTAKPQPAAEPQKPQQPQKPSKPQPTQSGPCTCKFGVCTCCSGPVLDLIRQKACMKIAYTPEDFAFDFSMMLNNRVMYQNRVSGKNPPPACISLPRFNSLRLCTKFSNLYFVGRNLHVCLGLEGKWDSFELFQYSFDCLRMGADGVHFLKPEDGGYTGTVGGLDAIIDAGDDIEDYDENVVRSAKANILRMIRNKAKLQEKES